MAIAASGAVSFSDLRTEFVGGSSAISLNDLYRGGSNILSKAGDNPATNLAASVPTSGVIDIQDFYSTAKAFKNTVSNSTTNVDADALFGDDYDVNYPKIIDINSGVTIGGSGDDAIDIPSGLAGTLTINNAGNILGAGGAAGAAGGNGINCASSGVTINNTGLLAGGGGGGGNGGNGGNGSTSSTSTSYQYNSSSYYWYFSSAANSGHAKWGGSTVVPYISSYGQSSSGIYRKGGTRHEYSPGGDGYARWNIGRTTTSTSSTSGGAGGSGGVGQGYTQTNASGAAGAAGGTSAGTGGTGGAGATYGTAGSTGSTGANGNSSNGASGASGGAAGAAVAGTSITMNNSGTIHGAVA